MDRSSKNLKRRKAQVRDYINKHVTSMETLDVVRRAIGMPKPKYWDGKKQLTQRKEVVH